MNDQSQPHEPIPVPQIDMILRDGTRRVAVHRLAEGAGRRTLVLCHPAPGAGKFDPDPQQTLARDVTLLAADRPGYGQSDPLSEASWASVSSAADDVAAAIDHMVGGPSVSLVGRRVAGWRWR